jgi:rubredoxin
MSDLISRQAAIDAVSKALDRQTLLYGFVRKVALDAIKNLPTVQPERKRGHWVEIGDEPYDKWECDVCGFVIDGSGCIDPEEYRDVYKFCPNCGADMRGKQDERHDL